MGPFPSDLMGEGRHFVLNLPFQTVLGPAAFKKNLYVCICSTGVKFLRNCYLKANGWISLRNYPVHPAVLVQLRICM